MNLTPTRLVLLALGLAATLIVGLRYRGAFSPGPPVVRAAPPAPREVTLRDGKVRDLTKPAAGKLLVVHFWATWCAPCVEELPGMARWLAENGADPKLDFLAVSVDDDWKTVDAWLAKTKLEGAAGMPMALDPKKAVAQAFGTEKFPETWVLGPDGSVLFHSAGPLDWSDREFRKVVESLKARVGPPLG